MNDFECEREREREGGGVGREGEWGLERARRNEINKEGGEKGSAGDRREEGEMWEYVRNERYSDELFKA